MRQKFLSLLQAITTFDASILLSILPDPEGLCIHLQEAVFLLICLSDRSEVHPHDDTILHESNTLSDLVQPFLSWWIPALGSKFQTIYIAVDPTGFVIDHDHLHSLEGHLCVPLLLLRHSDKLTSYTDM